MKRISIDIDEFFNWQLLINITHLLNIEILAILENQKYGFFELPKPL